MPLGCLERLRMETNLIELQSYYFELTCGMNEDLAQNLVSVSRRKEQDRSSRNYFVGYVPYVMSNLV